jgi:hypothetical protein
MSARRLGVVVAALAAGLGISGPAHAVAGCGTGMGDFDGDGHKDVVIGSPNATVNGLAQAGKVEVRTTTSAGGVQVRTITAPLPHAGDHFGAAVSDIDLSTHLDATESCASLVVGAPGFDDGSEVDAGVVFVYPTLTSQPQRFDQNFDAEFPGIQRNAHFGAVLAQQSTGSSGSGLTREHAFYAAAPDYDLGTTVDTGVVNRVEFRVDPDGSVIMTDVTTISEDGEQGGRAERGDRFGAALSGTPYDHEVLVGVPGQAVNGHAGAGELWVWTPERVQRVTQDTAGVPGVAETGDAFGASLFLGSEVAGRARQQGGSAAVPVFVGSPREDVAGKADAGGLVQLRWVPDPTNGRGRVDTTGATFWTQNSAGVAGAAESGDRFGAAMESLDYTSTGGRTYVASAPGEDLSGVADAGGVASLGGSLFFSEATAGVPGTPGRSDRFGAVLGSARDIAPPPAPGAWSRGLLVGIPGDATGDGAVLLGLPHGSTTSVTRLLPGSANGAYGAALGATR